MIGQFHKPPIFADRFRSDDLDEIRAFMDHHNGAHWRRAHGRGPVGFDLVVLGGQDVAISWVRGRLPQTVRGQASGWIVHLPIEGAMAYRFGRREHRVAPGSGIVMAPRRDLTVALPAGRAFALRVGEASVAREAAARHLRLERHWRRVVAELPVEPDSVRALVEALEGFVRPTGTAGAAPVPDAGPAHARLIGWIVDRIGSRSPPAAASRMAAVRLRNVEEWIEANVHEPITLGRLCQVAGVGARSLQLAFAARHHATPLEFVTERRVAAAHARLVADCGELSVTRVAASVGIDHLGRFADRYRRLYGESPSATLRRRPPQPAGAGTSRDGVRAVRR
jgi:AraC-like DNA-binding protein